MVTLERLLVGMCGLESWKSAADSDSELSPSESSFRAGEVLSALSMEESVPVRVSFGVGVGVDLEGAFLALAKDLKMSEALRLRLGWLLVVVEVGVALPAELGREVSSFFDDGSGAALVSCNAVEVVLEVGLESAGGGGGRPPFRRLTSLLRITP